MAEVLFFGKKNCHISQEIVRKLKDMGANVAEVWSSRRKEPLPEFVHQWVGDYIFCFRSYYILKQSLLSRAEIAAINIHPGPPEYPGSGCINFALYDEAKQFGATLHVMNSEVDSGQILKVARFDMTDDESVLSLLKKTHAAARALALSLLPDILTGGQATIDALCKENNEQWQGPARKVKELDALQKISPNITSEALERQIRATYIEGYPPFIELHGHKFIYQPDSKESS